MTTRAELSSLATGLHELAGRITSIVDNLSGDEQEKVGAALFEVERTLKSAERRLSRVLDQ